MKEIKQKILIEALIKKIKEIISEKDAHIKRNYFRERRSHQKKKFLCNILRETHFSLFLKSQKKTYTVMV